MYRALLVGLAFACLSTGPARAQDDEPEPVDYARSGWYLGVHGIAALPAYRIRGSDPDLTGGGNLRLGYRASELLALEIMLEGSPTPAGNGTEGYTIVGGVNGVLHPLRGRWQPYGLIGVNAMSVSASGGTSPPIQETDWGFRFGLGLDYYITPHIAASLEGSYVWGVGDVWELDYGSVGVGVLYRFGGE